MGRSVIELVMIAFGVLAVIAIIYNIRKELGRHPTHYRRYHKDRGKPDQPE